MVHRTNKSEETLNMDKRIGESLTTIAYLGGLPLLNY